MSLVTPVDVSLWVTKTALMSGFSARALRMASGSAGVPHVAVSRVTDAPNASAICASRSPNTPMVTQSTWSPGERTLTTAASMAPVPDPVRISTSPLVLKTSFSLSVQRCSMSWNSGPRWLIMSRFMASRT